MQQLFEKLQPETLILTANRRQAAFLRHEYDQWHLQQGHQAWPSLSLFPYNIWLTQCWQQACLNKQLTPQNLLTDFQAQLVWEEIIAVSEIGQDLLNVTPTAKLAKEAWQNLQLWQVDINHPAFDQTQESRYLQQWVKNYLKYCKENRAIDNAVLANQITSLFVKNKLNAIKTLIFIGFDEFNPQQQQLIAVLQQQGIEVILQATLSSNSSTNSINRIALTDTAEELVTMARWAKLHLDENHYQRIACVIPNLNEMRPQVERCFNEIFAPEKLLKPHAAPSHLFNISAGMALTEFPLLHTALLILKLSLRPTSFALWSTLLRSPFIAAAENECQARAKLEVKLRHTGEILLSLEAVLTQASPACPQWQNCLKQIKQLLKDTPKKQKPSSWVTYFSEKLKLMGWPGERQMDSTEYQLLQRWQQLLLEFAALDNFCGEITYYQAYRHLQNLLTNNMFQPQSPEAPVQVLGILEAAGLPFDHIWIMNMADINWPATARPNPFIPIAIQRQFNMPHATPERELNIAKKLTDNFCKSANNVIFSHPLINEDRHLRPSNLITAFPNLSIIDLCLPAYQAAATFLQQQQNLEHFIDEYGPALLPDEKIRGGAAVLQHQAACPFRAFAKLRLGAQALNEATVGLDALERGTLLHRILEIIWQQISNHATLIKLTDTELAGIINASITTALTAKQLSRPQTLMPRFLNIEQLRLSKLLLAWLEIEKTRGAFNVMATELQQTITIAGLALQVRIDRIDQLENGDYVIIDYKTGSISIYDWLGDRPDAPQLPLYCLGADFNNINGLLFAKINAKELALKGLVHDEIKLDFANVEKADAKKIDIKSLHDLKEQAPTLEWELLLAQWRATLHHLAEQFANGYAKVDPKNPHTTCNQCDLQNLCRIQQVF